MTAAASTANGNRSNIVVKGRISVSGTTSGVEMTSANAAAALGHTVDNAIVSGTVATTVSASSPPAAVSSVTVQNSTITNNNLGPRPQPRQLRPTSPYKVLNNNFRARRAMPSILFTSNAAGASGNVNARE